MSEKTKILNLKPGMENIDIDVRVIQKLGVRTINTKAGVRTLGEYIVGDESGRVKLVAWGSKAAALAEGDTVAIKNAWVTAFRGEVQLNIGKNSTIDRIPEESLPETDSIPETMPKAEGEYRPPSRGFQPRSRRTGGGRGRGRRSW